MRRGEIYYADLRTTRGCEQGGIRPVLIVQNDVGNYFSHTTVIAVLTKRSHHKPSLPTHVYIVSRDGLYSDSIVMAEQIRTIDKSRILSKITSLNELEMKEVEKALLNSLGIYH